jgi:hypothetical protein
MRESDFDCGDCGDIETAPAPWTATTVRAFISNVEMFDGQETKGILSLTQYSKEALASSERRRDQREKIAWARAARVERRHDTRRSRTNESRVHAEPGGGWLEGCRLRRAVVDGETDSDDGPKGR